MKSQTTGTPPPPTSSTGGGTSGANDHHRYVLVPQGSPYLAVPQPEPTSRTQVTFTENFYGSSITLVGYEIFEGEQFRIKNLPEGQVDLYFRYKGPLTGNTTDWFVNLWRRRMNVIKLTGQTVSVDSRKGYGLPNGGSSLPGLDPNAPPRHPNFLDWTYKGGLFVGNAPPSSMDQSGTARMLSFFTLPTLVKPIGGTYAAMSLGYSPQMGGAVTLTLCPFATSVTAGQVNWSNHTISPTSVLAQQDLSSLPAWEYMNLSFTAPGGTYDYSKLGVMLQNEAAKVTAGTASWRYFATSATVAAGAYPLANDGNPRLWILDRTTADLWQLWDSVTTIYTQGNIP